MLGTAEKARISYEQAVQFSFWRVALHTLICSLAGVGAMVATAWFIIPDANKMQALREEKAQLGREHRCSKCARRSYSLLSLRRAAMRSYRTKHRVQTSMETQARPIG